MIQNDNYCDYMIITVVISSSKFFVPIFWFQTIGDFKPYGFFSWIYTSKERNSFFLATMQKFVKNKLLINNVVRSPQWGD